MEGLRNSQLAARSGVNAFPSALNVARRGSNSLAVAMVTDFKLGDQHQLWQALWDLESCGIRYPQQCPGLYDCNPALGRWRHLGQEFKVIA